MVGHAEVDGYHMQDRKTLHVLNRISLSDHVYLAEDLDFVVYTREVVRSQHNHVLT